MDGASDSELGEGQVVIEGVCPRWSVLGKEMENGAAAMGEAGGKNCEVLRRLSAETGGPLTLGFFNTKLHNEVQVDLSKIP